VPAPGGVPPVENVLRVNLHLDDLLFDPERGNTLSQAIVEQAAEQLLDGLRAEMITQARAHALSILNERLSSIIEAMLNEAIGQAIQGTDHYGQPKGDPTTLHEVIVKRAEQVLRTRRDPQRSGYGQDKPLIEQIIDTEIGNAFKRELADVVAQARTEVLAAVKDQAAQIITDTIAKSVPR
jgi:hypothetical protein